MAIQSFGDPYTKEFFISGKVLKGAGWGNIRKVVSRKLDMIDFALVLADLMAPPGNKLEPLRGDLDGFYSIRINAKWRIIFVWEDSGPECVEITDYH